MRNVWNRPLQHETPLTKCQLQRVNYFLVTLVLSQEITVTNSQLFLHCTSAHERQLCDEPNGAAGYGHVGFFSVTIEPLRIGYAPVYSRT
jgi:hypothetical protein